MPNYRITLINDQFSAENDEEHSDGAVATHQALKGALEVGVEQVLGGQPLFGAEVTVDDGQLAQRYIVTVGASRLND